MKKKLFLTISIFILLTDIINLILIHSEYLIQQSFILFYLIKNLRNKKIMFYFLIKL